MTQKWPDKVLSHLGVSGPQTGTLLETVARVPGQVI